MTDSAQAPLGADAMFTQVYDRLKAMAGRRLAMGARGTLETTVLVHELYLRLSGNDALAFERPEQFFGYAARVVELIWFAGLTHEQAASTLGLNRRTIERDWRFARAYLKSELDD